MVSQKVLEEYTGKTRQDKQYQKQFHSLKKWIDLLVKSE